MPTGNVIAGIGLYIAINVPVFIKMNQYTGTSEHRHTVMAIGAVALAVIALLGGGALLLAHNRSTKAIGLGLIIGGALSSVLSAGYCTGLNPSDYRSY
ncbi:hypothetical protein [Mycobacterium timonense]|uniref:Uncharacterized protein n=1 Tax=Mycobacterium timonense TaxID=701043 RepID=A0ABX3TD29_9MYCO|nr:hypothetical protein [Mycobacterium timonense]ORB76684.1 hypothetical protein BST46_28720 [Mycobacterium timonense]